MTSDLAYDGRQPYRPHGGQRKPLRFDEMVAAKIAGNEPLFHALAAQYKRDECGEP